MVTILKDDSGRTLIRVAVYAIIECDGKILLHQRQNSGYMDGCYGVPSGHVEGDENLVSAVIRECKEETDIDVEANDVVFDYVTYRNSAYMYACFFFKIKRYCGIPRLMEPDKCGDLRFFSKTDLPKNMVPELVQYFADSASGIKLRDK